MSLLWWSYWCWCCYWCFYGIVSGVGMWVEQRCEWSRDVSGVGMWVEQGCEWKGCEWWSSLCWFRYNLWLYLPNKFCVQKLIISNQKWELVYSLNLKNCKKNKKLNIWTDFCWLPKIECFEQRLPPQRPNGHKFSLGFSWHTTSN